MNEMIYLSVRTIEGGLDLVELLRDRVVERLHLRQEAIAVLRRRRLIVPT